jgi:hypothetical protein
MSNSASTIGFAVLWHSARPAEAIPHECAQPDTTESGRVPVPSLPTVGIKAQTFLTADPRPAHRRQGLQK